MPEDMRELFRQRQRELAAERAELAATAEENADENALPAGSTEPKLEQVTMPPPPKTDNEPSTAPPKSEAAPSKVETPPPPTTTRPREATEPPAKKKGKKGEGEP
jgi:hypothetical protein